MTDQMDYPAAHSMDTDWFAVDPNGHVGVFLSHESGAMPSAFRNTPYGQILNWYYLKVMQTHTAAVSNPTVKSLLAEQSPLLLKGKATTWDQLPDRIMHAVVRSNLNAPFSRHTAKLTEGMFSEIYFTTPGELRKGFEEGRFTHVWAETMLLNLLGLFTFEHGHQWENWIAGPYDRHTVPVLPLKESDLPAELRLCAPVELPANNFVTDNVIQPIDSIPCATWQHHAYVAIDKKTIRPMPPNETLSYDEQDVKKLQDRGLIIGAPIDPDQ